MGGRKEQRGGAYVSHARSRRKKHQKRNRIVRRAWKAERQFQRAIQEEADARARQDGGTLPAGEGDDGT